MTDHTLRYPHVAATVARLKPSTLVLDGELAVFDEQLRSRFEWFRDPDEAVSGKPRGVPINRAVYDALVALEPAAGARHGRVL
jgi:ATP-dependent DNA ligase